MEATVVATCALSFGTDDRADNGRSCLESALKFVGDMLEWELDEIYEVFAVGRR